MKPLGTGHGYQHLWVESIGELSSENLKLTWLGDKSFYSLTTSLAEPSSVIFTMLGANDPEFNLRRDQGIILRLKEKKNAAFVSIIESHGHYDPVNEIASNAFSSVRNIFILQHDKKYSIIEFEHLSGARWVFAISNDDASTGSKHMQDVDDQKIEWVGPYYLNKL